MWNGTETEFEQILGEYRPALYGTAFTYLNSNSEIDDVVQETFIEFYYKYDTIRDKTKIGAWLCGVCRNIALKRLRAMQFTLPLDHAAGKATADPADLYEKADRKRAVRAAILRLSQPVAETVSLYYITGLSIAKIADCLGVPQGTVKSRLYEGRRKLKGELEFMMESNLSNEKDITEKLRKILGDADNAMKHANDSAAVLLLDNAIAEIGENNEHYRILAELYRKRAEAEFMCDRQKSEEDDARALSYAKLTRDEVLIAKYMLMDAYTGKTTEENIERMRATYELAKRNNLNGICAEAAYWEGLQHIRKGDETCARERLALALEHYEKIRAHDMIDMCDGNILRVHAFADGALKALDMLRDAGREMNDWESCNTFCQILRRDGETITKHNNYGWGIPGKQFNYCSVHGVFDGQGYVFPDELIDHDTVIYEYYNFSNLPVKMIYTVLSRDEEITTPAGHFSGCLKIHIREELTGNDAANPANRESVENLCEYTSIYCPGIGLISESCIYPNSSEQNSEYGGTNILCRYHLTSASSHFIPFEEGNEFEYIRLDTDGKLLSDKMNYRDIYRVDKITPDGVIYLANYGYGYYS